MALEVKLCFSCDMGFLGFSWFLQPCFIIPRPSFRDPFNWGRGVRQAKSVLYNLRWVWYCNFTVLKVCRHFKQFLFTKQSSIVGILFIFQSNQWPNRIVKTLWQVQFYQKNSSVFIFDRIFAREADTSSGLNAFYIILFSNPHLRIELRVENK